MEIARIIGNGVGFAVRSPAYDDLVVVEDAVGQPLGPQLRNADISIVDASMSFVVSQSG
jgi:hypothetical protein